jgi:hypothetical protein
MMHSLISWFLLLVQIALLICTAVVLPITIRPRWIGFLLYSLCMLAAWFAYTLGVMFFNSAVGHDTPGFGYLFIGFIGWCFGSIIFLWRLAKPKRD